MNLTLFNIKENYLKLISEIEENHGEISEEQISQLEINKDDLQEKFANYNEIISSKQNFNDRINEEINELKLKKYLNEKIIEKLKSNMVDAIKVFGAVDLGIYKFTTRKSVSVNVFDISLINPKFVCIKRVECPDKLSIKKSLQNGEEVSGCELVESYHLKRD